jgi:hypothetical protein
MVERFKRTKDSFVNKNRNISSKDYISLCYKQITINPSLQTRGSLGRISEVLPFYFLVISFALSFFSTLATNGSGMKCSGLRSCFLIHRYKVYYGLKPSQTPATAMFYTRCYALAVSNI